MEGGRWEGEKETKAKRHLVWTRVWMTLTDEDKSFKQENDILDFLGPWTVRLLGSENHRTTR